MADTAAARPVAITNFLLQSGSFKKKILKWQQTTEFASLSLNAPLSVTVKLVCMHLQDKGARLESTQWTAKQTKLGFSVCFFWLVQEAVVLKRCRKRSAKANRSAESPTTATLDPVEAGERQPPRTHREPQLMHTILGRLAVSLLFLSVAQLHLLI